MTFAAHRVTALPPVRVTGGSPDLFPEGWQKATCAAGNWVVGLYGLILPSGKLTKNYGKIHHFIAGKIHYFYGHFQ